LAFLLLIKTPNAAVRQAPALSEGDVEGHREGRVDKTGSGANLR
jgi:hypothetical protein